ncbi:hypothetical protein BOTBODRAFT_44782 [Botryobasidium botryosum FD-172 SS1]|uniref:Uncharacterized protein n=1 Tax=Botryobasidium botryosum (strain FD-172 SS1) TaxID=930990 RepID=A0A067MEC1_BOTB1|nr:hypothetical protein BOTBODRAFT_44782 [Botryobasidium botryosum FD-172 SS1]
MDIIARHSAGAVVTITIEDIREDETARELDPPERRTRTFVISEPFNISVHIPDSDEIAAAAPEYNFRPWSCTRREPPHFQSIDGTTPATTAEWKELAFDIGLWLFMCGCESATDEWEWGVNYYWIAYTGAYPDFPFTYDSIPTTPHHLWNDVIPWRGAYLSKRMLLKGGCVTENETIEARIELLADCVKDRVLRIIHTQA